jgi:hypothetical protein
MQVREMTLSDWCDANKVPLYEFKNCMFIVYHWYPDNPAYRQLFDLKDYIVSSVAGVTIWLVPRSSPA